MRYRKKPVTVEAMLAGEIRDLPMRERPAWVCEAMTSKRLVATPSGLIVRTLEGDMRAAREDWIVRGVEGELYPVKPAIFARTYEPAR